MNKPLLVGIVVLLLLVLVSVFMLTSSMLPGAKPSPGPQVINPQGDTLLLETGKYHVAYLPYYNKYLVTITGSPFEQYRTLAEQEFLQVLGINAQQACTLNVTVSTPRFANPNEAGKDYPLSFCESFPKPTPTIDPALIDLSVQKVHPIPGTVEMGGTRNGIFITFPQEVDINTVNIEISPNMPFRLLYDPRNKNIITLSPGKNWESNTNYTITIKAGAFSLNNSAQLKEDVVLTYQVKEVQFQDDEHGEHITP